MAETSTPLAPMTDGAPSDQPCTISKAERTAHPFAGISGEPFIVPIAARPDCGPGWLVRIPLPDRLHRPTRAAVITRNFCRGTPEETLARARAWRDEWHLKLWGRPVPTRFFHRQQANGRTGVPGVRRQVKRFRSSGREYAVDVYVAEVWLQPGRNGDRPRQSRSRIFSIAKWGEQTAFEMACAWRRYAEDRLARGEPLEVGRLGRRRRPDTPDTGDRQPQDRGTPAA